jgi:hypothetical protein
VKQQMNEQELRTFLQEKMLALMDVYHQCKMHAFTVTDEVRAYGLLLVEEQQVAGTLIVPKHKSEQILLVAEVLREVTSKHQQMRQYS